MPRLAPLPKDFAFDLTADPSAASGGLLEVTDCRGTWLLQGTAIRNGEVLALAWRIDPYVHVLCYYSPLMGLKEIAPREGSAISLAWEFERVPCSDRIPWVRHKNGDDAPWMYRR